MASARTEGIDRRLAAVWFADLVDYTRLSAEDDAAAIGLVRAFQEATRELVAREGGRIVKFVGDAALAVFPSTSAAVAAALDLQESLDRRLDASRQTPRAVRAGVHAGEVSGTPDGDVYGDGVNVASRIHAAAEPGAVVVSEEVARHLRARRELVLEPLGDRSLKGISEPMRLFAVRRAEDGFAVYAAPAVGGQDAEIATASKSEPNRGSIAVLPFANLSADPENEYFSDGVTEEILTALARVEGLKVISRTSVMRYKGTTKALREIGRELGVRSILEGSVRRAGDRVRISAQLIDAGTDQHLWVDRYDRHLEDIFAIQTDVAEQIVEALKVRLTPRERARLAGAAKTNREAYDAYLKGLWSCARRSLPDLRRGREHLERAIRIDPEYAPAWAGLASACVHQLMWGMEGDADARDRALEAAERALTLDPELGEAYGARALVRMYSADWSGTEVDFARALELSPGDANTRQWYASFLAGMGRFDEAFAEIEQARELDPVSLPVATEAGNIRTLSREADEALRLYKEALAIDPTFRPAHYKLVELYTTQGRHAEALEEWVRLGKATEAEAATARDANERGDPSGCFAVALRDMETHRWSHSYRAWLLGWMGRIDEALDELERAVEEGDLYLYRLARGYQWDPLRNEPRFQRILERLGLDSVPSPRPAS